MKKLQRTALAIVATAVISGCASEATPRPAGLEAYTFTDRPSDGLLHNPLLQRVVDRQTARDVAGLDNFFSHSDPLVRARAAFAAASVQSVVLTPSLVRLLNDPDPRVRADAAFALGQMADSTVSDKLVDALLREREVVAQTRLIEAIGKTGDRMALTQLLTMPSSYSMEAEIALAVARFGLRDIHTDESVAWVARRLSHEDPQLRLNSAFYFGITPTSRPWALHAAYVRDALEDYSMDDPAAMHVALGLGRFHGADGRLMLVRLANALDWRVRANTAAALAPLSSDPRVLEGLLTALDDSNHHVATTAAGSLGWSEILEDSHLDRIETWVSDHPENHMERASLLSVLATKGRNDFVLSQVQETIKLRQPGLASFLQAVALVQNDQAFSMLSGMARSSDWDVSTAALEALVTRWSLWQGAVDGIDSFTEVFTDAVGHANTKTVLIAGMALMDPEFKELGALSVIDTAYARVAAHDTDATIVLLDALGATSDVRFLSLARRGNQHENHMVRRAAANAVAQLTGKRVTTEDWFTNQPMLLDWSLLAGLGPHPTLQLETTRGTITIELMTEQAPFATQTVVSRAQVGQYNGTDFHRVVPNFIVQGGDVTARAESNQRDLMGKTEITRVPFGTGVVGLANVGRDTEGSQFFITHSMQPQLDGSFTAFGYVVDGMDVVDQLTLGDVIINATVVPDLATS